MKKLILIGVLLSLSTGCGRGWLPCRFRGASCGSGGCIGAAPALPQGCTTCVGGNAAGYGEYEGEMGGSYYSGETIVGDSYGGQVVPSIGSGMTMQPMQSLPAHTLPAP